VLARQDEWPLTTREIVDALKQERGLKLLSHSSAVTAARLLISQRLLPLESIDFGRNTFCVQCDTWHGDAPCPTPEEIRERSARFRELKKAAPRRARREHWVAPFIVVQYESGGPPPESQE